MNLKKKVQAHLSVKNMLAGSIAALFFLIALTGYGFYKQNETEVTSDLVVHTQTVISELQDLDSRVYESVTAQRGYVITAQQRYEEIFENSQEELDSVLRSVTNLTREDTLQQEIIMRLRKHISDLRALYTKTFEFVRSGESEQARQIITSGKGQALIERIHKNIEKMISHEEKLLKKRLRENEDARNDTYRLITASSALAILFILAALLMMYREFKNRLKIQEDLSLALDLQDAVVKATPFSLVTVDSKGTINLFNPAAEKMLGYSAEEAVGKPLDFWHLPDEIAAASKKLSERFGERVPLNSVLLAPAERNIIESSIWTMEKKNGSILKASLTLAPLRNSNNETYGYVAISYDMTKQLEYEQNIIEAREQALAGTKAKSEFLANMSHEIRTPMNAIMGMAELLIETNLEDEQRKYVEIFQRAGDSLLNIINDILDLSKIEAGQFELDCMPFKLSNLIHKSVEIIALKAHQKNLELVVDIDKDLPEFFTGDSNRIRQILLNLLGNSLKFTKKGEILLRLSGRSIPESLYRLTMEVEDTGIGMSEENAKKLFERFSQADSSITKEFGGTGLGLSIAKRLTELMQGDIKVKSTLGLGSKFTVTITLKIDEASSEDQQTIDLTGTRVLIVDDTRTNRLITRKILEDFGAQVQEAEDGIFGMELIRGHEAKGAAFDLIVIDSRMPYMDGFSLAEKIQSSVEMKGPILMMLTSDNRPGEILRARELGLQSFIVKPILKMDLIEAISKAYKKKPAIPPQISTAQTTPTEKTINILVVDDNDENRLVLTSFLKSRPWKIDVAKNGAEAVDQFKKLNYDIVFMDMQMPIMDGYTATREIRKYEKEKKLPPKPILALTAYALKEEIDKSISAGCNGHLSKPISKSTLIAAIEEYTTAIEVLIDKDLEDLIPDYLASRKSELNILKTALEGNDYALIQSLGHKLRGSAGSYGFSQLSEIGKEFEENAKVQGATNIEKALSHYQSYLKNVKVKYQDPA